MFFYFNFFPSGSQNIKYLNIEHVFKYKKKIGLNIKIYKLERILMLEVDLKSASNFRDFFYKIRFLYDSLSKSGNTI